MVSYTNPGTQLSRSVLIFCPPIIHPSSLVLLHSGLNSLHKFIICQAFFIIVLGFRPFESSSWNWGLHLRIRFKWSGVATTLMQASPPGLWSSYGYAWSIQNKEKHIKITLKKYVLVQLHAIHLEFFTIDAFLQVQFSLICQLGLVVVLSYVANFHFFSISKSGTGTFCLKFRVFFFFFKQKIVVNFSLIKRLFE